LGVLLLAILAVAIGSSCFIGLYTVSGTVTLSGGAGLAGVMVTIKSTTSAATSTTTTDSTGAYTLLAVPPGTYTVTPSLAGYGFSPASSPVTVSTADITGVNFVGSALGISGVVSLSGGGGLSGVKITYSGPSSGLTTTDSTGSYSISPTGGLPIGIYNITPSLPGYSFNPASIPVTISNSGVTGVNFTASVLPSTYTISGTVSGTVSAGVTITLSGASSASKQTDSSGKYSFSPLLNGTYIVTPSLTGYSFSPSSTTVTLNGADATGEDFVSSANLYSISGTVSGGAGSPGVPGVIMSLTGAATSSITSSPTGSYSLAGLVNGTYTVTPSKPGYSFIPPSASLTINDANVSGVNFAVPGNVPRYLFQVNGDGSISTYAVVESTGQLRSVTYLDLSTVSTPGQPTLSALNPSGNSLYTLQPNADTSLGQVIMTYSINASGALKLAALSSNPVPGAVQISPDPLGRFLWVADSSGQILSYPLDPVTAAPGTQTVAANVPGVAVIAADPTGSYLFSEDTSGNVAAYTISSTGTLTPLGTPPLLHPTSGDAMIVDPSGKYLYVSAGSSVFGYTISSTGLASISGSPFLVLCPYLCSGPGGSSFNENVSQMTIDQSISALFAADNGTDYSQPIAAFLIGPGGVLTPSLFIAYNPSGPTGVQQVQIDPSGKYLLAAFGSGNSKEIDTYSVPLASHPPSGIRGRSASSSVPVGPLLMSLGLAATGVGPQFLYVTNSGSNTISQFSISNSTGELTSLASPLAVQNKPVAIAVQPNQESAYVALSTGSQTTGGDQLVQLSITNGVLSPVSQTPTNTGTMPTSLAIDVSGSFLYNTNEGDSLVLEYSIAGGTLPPTDTSSSQETTGSAPVFIATEPTGQFVYTANSGPGNVGVFAIQQPGGGLVSQNGGVPIAPVGAGPSWITTDPGGRFLYVASPKSDSIAEFLITASNGIPVANSNPYILVGVGGSNPGAVSIVVEPSGQFLYAANESANQIFAFSIEQSFGFASSIDQSLGLLAAVQGSLPSGAVANTGTTPVALAVDVSGQFLYCVNSGSNDISMYKINLADGSLTPVGTGTVPTGGTAPAAIAVSGALH
jgi:6-phosphogluconolactonase (cycloisomerase 2 family)